jgi:ATP-binding cassette subfamily F protein uup
VSHDREFLDNVVTSCFVLAGDGEVVQTAGGYAESKRIIARAKERAREQDLAAAEPKISSSASAPVKKKLSYKETRELEALPEKISTLEAEIAQIESTLADASIYAREPAKAAELTLRMAAARDELDAAETRWLELSEV